MKRLGVPGGLRDQGTGIARSREFVEPFEPDRRLRDGDVIAIPDFDLEVVHTPGHCPEEVVLWQPELRLMFSGDHLLPEITPVCLLQIPESPRAERVPSLVQYVDSLMKVEALPALRTLPSHGGVIEDHRELIESYRLHTEKRKLKLVRVLERGEATPFELGERMFRRVVREQLYLVLSEVVGHLDLLEREGSVVCRESKGAFRYSLTGTGASSGGEA
jgi:glyoxylase-like metal-dependent hydrolase (beta-lactamase superfamily II)